MKKANYANTDCEAMRVPGSVWEQKSMLFLTALVGFPENRKIKKKKSGVR